MQYRGLFSFSLGGTILVVVLMNIVGNAYILEQPTSPAYTSVVLQNALLGFIGFLLIGLGLQLSRKQ